ncbi:MULTISPECIES: lipid-A-disaccharide synthase [unclassified Synechococcus]|uniref:lipid-A-disaccharide synthase n=1 Tax=unclassified Synechococcus TaxID=2626047 RepID=UPI0021A7DE2D|nr:MULTISPECIES: lipid-A-disaccharide synthase [unclassified Synechococcus]MCT0212257.1 lipid-A-disaccharide synthase [Synechococcus sp. CS-1326]MCT0234330.1 lipid-A-disaccharide synthase [Synechococcus sp. CS-1327]
MVRLLISTGEVSGDLQGGLLIQALHAEARRRELDLEIIALGGERMERAGARLLANTAPMGAMGLWEALPLVLPTLRLQRRVGRLLRQTPPDGVVLIDYMGANVSLGLKLRRQLPGVPITYYIAPQEWAFRIGEGGSTRLIGFTDRILSIFPEEARFYGERGADVTWVGHPLLDTLGDLPGREEARRELGLLAEERLLLLLPASRSQEMRYLVPNLAAAAAELQRLRPGLRVMVPAGQAAFEAPLAALLRQAGVQAEVVPASDADRLRPVLSAAADLALTKSGTVNLELALRGVPQVVGYRVSRPTAWLARHLLHFRVDHISPVNLVLGERLVPELLQESFTAAAVVAAALPLLDPGEARERMIEGYGRLRLCLGEPGVTGRAAVEILDHLAMAQPSAAAAAFSPAG